MICEVEMWLTGRLEGPLSGRMPWAPMVLAADEAAAAV
jgi:hypothetical protein